jgi:hypothetical protein
MFREVLPGNVFMKYSTIFKWYENRQQCFEERGYGRTTELFIMRIQHFLQMGETDSTVKLMNGLLERVEWQMKKRANERKERKG